LLFEENLKSKNYSKTIIKTKEELKNSSSFV